MENGLLNISSGALCVLQGNLSRFSSCAWLLGKRQNTIDTVHLLKRDPLKGPDPQMIHSIINKVWLPDNIGFAGVAFSHSLGLYNLTYEDELFCKALCAGGCFPGCAPQCYALLIVQAAAGAHDFDIIPYCVSARNTGVTINPAKLLINGTLYIPVIQKQYGALDYSLAYDCDSLDARDKCRQVERLPPGAYGSGTRMVTQIAAVMPC